MKTRKLNKIISESRTISVKFYQSDLITEKKINGTHHINTNTFLLRSKLKKGINEDKYKEQHVYIYK